MAEDYEPTQFDVWHEMAHTDDTIPDPPTTFDANEIMLLRKAAWIAAVKYDNLRIKAQNNKGVRPLNAGSSPKYWTEKHEEMTALYEKLGTVVSLTAPPF